MKPGFLASLALVIAWMICAAALGIHAQPFSVQWHTMDGGGGTSSGGLYSASGTLGQPDAGLTMTNGQYSMTGGFWVLPQAVQIPGAPQLSIIAAGPGIATISWEPASAAYVLQETMSLAAANWIDSASGTNNPTDVALTNAVNYYRLRKP